VEDTTYKGRRCLQLIECKYFTDFNAIDTINNIQNIYESLKQAIIIHKRKRLQVQIIPIVVSRTRNFHTRTLAEISQLVSFEENPLETLTYKTLSTQAKNIAMAIHIHAQEMYTLISKVSRSNLTKPRKTKQNGTHTNNAK
jgi:hypothetical protein